MIVYVIAKIDPVLVYIHVLEVFKCSKERKVFKSFMIYNKAKRTENRIIIKSYANLYQIT